MELNKEEYNKYCRKVDKHDFIPKLTEAEFTVKQKYPHHCFDFNVGISVFNPASSGYMIHNEKTAKYKDGNIMDIMSQEFEKKWY